MTDCLKVLTCINSFLSVGLREEHHVINLNGVRGQAQGDIWRQPGMSTIIKLRNPFTKKNKSLAMSLWLENWPVFNSSIKLTNHWRYSWFRWNRCEAVISASCVSHWHSLTGSQAHSDLPKMIATSGSSHRPKSLRSFYPYLVNSEDTWVNELSIIRSDFTNMFKNFFLHLSDSYNRKSWIRHPAWVIRKLRPAGDVIRKSLCWWLVRCPRPARFIRESSCSVHVYVLATFLQA